MINICIVLLVQFIILFSIAPSMSGSHRKAKSTAAVDFKHSSMFFGYDLLDDITEDDILSFLEEFKQSIVSIEVEFNEKHGNYARVTFETSTDAREAMTYYSGWYWYEFGVHVVLKPWKEKERPQKRKKQQQNSKHVYDDVDDDNLSTCSESTQKSETYSCKDLCFLLPYPDSKAGKPIYSESSTKSKDSKQQEKKLTGSSGSRKEEYTVKISGLSFDVNVLKLVKLFGDLTSPVRIASYPQNGICYAYVNYCGSSSASAAVAELDRSEFNNTRVHVCYRGKLGVDHSCCKKLQELAEEEYYDIDSVDDVKQLQDTSILHLLQADTQEPEQMAASSMSIGKMHLKPLTNSPKHDISDSDPCRSDSHEDSLAEFNSLLKDFEKSPETHSPHTEQKKATKKSGGVTSYGSVAKSSPKSINKASSKKKHSQSVGKNTIDAPEKSTVDQSSKYQTLSYHEHCPMQTKPRLSSVDNLPDADPAKKQTTMTNNDSVDTLPQCVKVLFDSNILTRQIISEDSASMNVPLTISPHKQLIETVGNATSCSLVTQSSFQAVKSVEDLKPDHASRQQPKFDASAVESNCILEVTNLHPDASVQDLDRYFKPYGALKAPISIRLHPISDSCSAIVHYMSPNAAQNAMKRLNGCDISGYQMHIVNANDKDADVKIPSDIAPVTSDSTTVNDSSLVVPSNLLTPDKKTVENKTTLSIQ